jgi:hypothetical protein
MAQLYCYVPDALAEQVQHRATQAGLNLSRHLAELIKKDVSEHNAWPEGYFELFGQWQGEPLVRTDSLLLEDRIASS